MLRHCHEGHVIGDQEWDCGSTLPAVSRRHNHQDKLILSQNFTHSHSEEEPEDQSYLCPAPLEVPFL